MDKHAIEQLEAIPSIPSDGFECYWLKADGVDIGSINGPQSGEQEQRARRLVACWNACAGMPTDVLEDTTILKASRDILDQRDDLLAALKTSRGIVESLLRDSGYGFFRPANPHDFTPDQDCCTPKEIAAHKADCEAYDRGEYVDDPAEKSGWSDDGKAHITRNSWGIGSYTYTDPQVQAVLEQMDAAIAKAVGR